MSDTRIEKDSMGEMEVPANAYYGAQTARAGNHRELHRPRLPPGVVENMPPMAEKDRVLASLRVWIATAWADGTIAEPERAALGRMIDYSTMPEEFRAQARGWLETPPLRSKLTVVWPCWVVTPLRKLHAQRPARSSSARACSTARRAASRSSRRA